ncbi:MAG: CARDB domain-containing protein, partial [Candidatus Thorarchaeota archaeon]
PPVIDATFHCLIALLPSGSASTDTHIKDGINWIMNQRVDGDVHWDNNKTLTSKVVILLEEVGEYQTEVNDAINWIKQQQNPDGGWGIPHSSVDITSWVLIALNRTGNEGLESLKGIEWLLSLQNSDCGWAKLPGNPASDTLNTAIATWALAVSEYETEIDLELTFNKPYYYPGETITMTVNPLNAEAESLTLSGKVTEYEGNVYSIDFIQVGEAFEGSHVLSDNHLAGTDTVSIVASGDSGQGVITGTFIVKSGEEVLPDVSIVDDDIAFSSNDPQGGETIGITATITNQEIRDAVNVIVRCYNGYPEAGGILIGEESVDRVCGLNSSSIEFNWLAVSGTHEIYVVVDPDHILAETNEQNNQAYKVINVSEVFFKPDLSINTSDITLTPSDPIEGEEVVIEAAVHNRGGGVADDVLVQFLDGNSQFGEDQIISTLPPGGSEVVEVSWDSLGEWGRNYIHVIVDPDNSILEANENNNEAIKIVDVGAPSLPDLTINASDISLDPPYPLEGDIVIISATIHNRGISAKEIKVSFYDGEPEDSGTLIQDEFIYSTIPFGGSRTLEIKWETVGSASVHEIFVVIDPENMIKEEKEKNNRASAGISIEESGLSVDVSLDEIQYETNEDLQISTVITNLVSEERVTILDLLVLDSEGNTISKLILEEVVTLSAGSLETIDAIWNTGNSRAGEYTVVAVVKENGTPRAIDQEDFIIIADISLSAEVTTDKMTYLSYEQVKITS